MYIIFVLYGKRVLFDFISKYIQIIQNNTIQQYPPTSSYIEVFFLTITSHRKTNNYYVQHVITKMSLYHNIALTHVYVSGWLWGLQRAQTFTILLRSVHIYMYLLLLFVFLVLFHEYFYCLGPTAYPYKWYVNMNAFTYIFRLKCYIMPTSEKDLLIF